MARSLAGVMLITTVLASIVVPQRDAAINVNVLRITNVPVLDSGYLAAHERIRLNQTLTAKFNITVTRRLAERSTPTMGIGPTLRVMLDELTKFNTTYAFVIGPDFTAETVAIGQMLPVYNLISVGKALFDDAHEDDELCYFGTLLKKQFSSLTSKVFSDKKNFPLFFRGAAKTPDYTRAFLTLIKALQASAITTMALNEQYAVDGIRDVEQSMVAGGVKLQYSGVFDDTSRAEVANNIIQINPNYIVSIFFGVVEPKIVCDLLRKKLSAQHTIYLIGGPFGIQEWWMPRPSDPEWKCSLAEFASALNGSFLVDQFFDHGHYAPETSQRTKIGGLDGIQLNELMTKYMRELQQPKLVGSAYTTYDIFWAAMDALYRTEAKLGSAALDTALSFSTYKTKEYADYSRVMVDELRKTQFYGVTGDFRFDNNNNRQMDLQIFQFRPPDISYFTTNSSNSTTNNVTLPLVLVGNYSVRHNVINFHEELVQYATPNNRPPHIWEQQQRDADEKWSQTRLIIIIVVCGIALVVFVLGVFIWLYRRSATRSADLSWLVMPDRVKILVGRTNTLGGSTYSAASTASQINIMQRQISGGGGDGMSLTSRGRSMASSRETTNRLDDGGGGGARAGRGRARVIGASGSSGRGNATAPTIEVWMRKIPQTLEIQQLIRQLQKIYSPTSNNSGLELVSSQLAAQINAPFSEASTLRTLSQQHANINRFVGICFGEQVRKISTASSDHQAKTTMDRGEAMIFFDFAPKGSLRSLLLYNETFSLDLTLKYSFMYDIASAVQFMHATLKLTHGFLHSNNVVLDNRFTAKLTDFAFLETRPATDFVPYSEAEAGSMDNEALELLLSRAPELLKHGIARQNKQANETAAVLSASVDVYSMGTIFVEIFSRCLPFLSTSIAIDVEREQVLALLHQLVTDRSDKLAAFLTSSIIPSKSSPAAAHEDFDASVSGLILRCTNSNPSMRPSPADVVKWIRALPNYTPGSSVVESLIVRLQTYASNLEGIVAERTRALADEMERSEQLLLQILPPTVAQKLKAGHTVDPEAFEIVSIYFSDIVGFTAMSADASPMEVVTLLNRLYTLFDSVLENFDVYKVETIGDAYMVASGLPIRNESRHLTEVASMSLQLLAATQHFEIPVEKAESDDNLSAQLRLRIGLHCGPCVAGVVGIKMPRYCLFGDTVNTTSRMESTGEALKIHISDQFNKQLHHYYDGKFLTAERGVLEIKGKGSMKTYWLVGKV